MPTTLYVIHSNTLTSAQRSMVASLQGIVSRSSGEQIYLHPDFGGYQTWLADLQANWGVTLVDVTDPWWLVDHFRSRLGGYLFYSGANDSLNAATSLAGVEDSIVVDSSLESQALLRGLPKRLDLTGRNEAWVVQNHGGRLNPKVAFEQLESFADELRDYAVLSRALFFHDGNSTFRNTVVDGLADDGMVMGWGDASGGEEVFVGAGSDRGVFTIAADYAHDLAPLSGVPTQVLQQPNHAVPTAEAGVHYVAFVMTDGDNLQWVLGQFQSDTRWFGSPYRGTFDMGYGMPPVLAELAPSVLAWYYAHASTGPGRDSFVVGPSGGGYFYPSRYPAGLLSAHVDRLADWMAVADLGLVQILDSNAFERRDLWELYTAKPGIDGLFYLEYSDYSAGAGQVVWSNGKPVIAARTKLWEGLANSDIESVKATLNGALRDPTSTLGYSMVPVAAWDDAMTKTKSVVDGLGSNVRVVTPEALVALMQQNVPHGVAFQHDYTTTDFGSSTLNLVGNALWISDPGALFQPWPQRLRLTSNNGGQNGSAWAKTKIDPSKSWETTFRFQISYPVGGGADGLGFHVQSDGALLNPGFLGSFANPSLSVVIDTWDNGEGTSESLKVRLNGTQVLFNDLADFASDPRPGSSSNTFRMTLAYSKGTHSLRIRIWDEGGTAHLDNTVAVNLDAFGASWAGFSATTGGSAENHDVRTWRLAAAAAP